MCGSLVDLALQCKVNCQVMSEMFIVHFKDDRKTKPPVYRQNNATHYNIIQYKEPTGNVSIVDRLV